MGIVSLATAVLGLLTTLCHYATHNVVMGAVTLVLLVASLATGIIDIRKQNKNGGIDYNKFQPGVVGHGFGGVILVLGTIMCVMAIVGKYPPHI